MTSSQSTRSVFLHVDLAGSRLGPAWLETDLRLAPPQDWDDERIRQETAQHYAVPLDQVGPVLEFEDPDPDAPRCPDCQIGPDLGEDADCPICRDRGEQQRRDTELYGAGYMDGQRAADEEAWRV